MSCLSEKARVINLKHILTFMLVEFLAEISKNGISKWSANCFAVSYLTTFSFVKSHLFPKISLLTSTYDRVFDKFTLSVKVVLVRRKVV